jgi:hypothetical protein
MQKSSRMRKRVLVGLGVALVAGVAGSVVLTHTGRPPRDVPHGVTVSSALPVVGLRPRADLTPGATNPDVTQSTIQATICVSGWTATVRPPTSYTNKLKILQIRQYGFTDTNPASYEEDHLLPLELGGAPRDPRNLWPEAYPGAHDKDRAENSLHRQVCAGTVTLAHAQRQILTDWGPR